MITLRQMQYFASLARHRHFGRAAEDCGVTQPALSMQIKELERELGASLVERQASDIVLTEAGLGVARLAEQILVAAHDLIDFARHREILAGPLKLGVVPTLAPYLLPKLLPHLQSSYRSLQLELRETLTAALVDDLIAGELDCALLALPLEDADLEMVALFEDHFLLAMPARERMPRRLLKTEDINPQRLILLEEGHCLRDQALAFCADGQHDAGSAFKSTSLTTVLQMVANGYGVTLLPEIAARAEVRSKRVALKRFASPQPGRTIGLAWRRTSSRRRDFEALGQAVKQTIGG